jgi:hypothetical protein
MSRGHPTDQVLLGWLDSAKPGRVGRHVDDCEQCLDRLDQLSAFDTGLLDELDSASAPPVDLARRTTGGAHGRIAAEEAMSTLVELFGLPWQTAVVMLDTTPTSTVVVDASTETSDDSDDEEHADG